MLSLPSLFLHGHFVVGNSNDILIDDEEDDDDDDVDNDVGFGVGDDNTPHGLRIFSFSTAVMALLAESLSCCFFCRCCCCVIVIFVVVVFFVAVVRPLSFSCVASSVVNRRR